MKEIYNVSPINHYLVHIFHYGFKYKEKHIYSTKDLNKLITELSNDKTVMDYVIYQKIDFETREID